MVDAYDEDGNKIEGLLTAEEAEAAATTAAEKAVEDLSGERQEEIDKVYADLKVKEDAIAELEKKLEGSDDKSKNFGAARQKIEDKEKEVVALNKKINDLESGLGKKIDDLTSTQSKQVLSQQILDAVGGDKELAAKVAITYGKFALATTPEGVSENIQNAVLIASGGKSPRLVTSRIIDGSGGVDFKSKPLGKLAEGAEDVAKNMGITDADMKKHGLK